MKISKRTFWIFFTFGMLFLVPSVLAQGENPPIIIGEVTAARVIATVAAGLSLLFDYAPLLAAKYDALPDSTKQLIALGTAAGLVALAFVLQCFNVISTNLVCSFPGAWDALASIVYVIAVQYGFHKATKPTAAYKANSYLNIKPAPNK